MKCQTCMRSLEPSAFYVSNQSRCKECVKASVLENRLKNADYYKAYDRSRANLPHRVKARLNYQKTDAFRISCAIANKRWAVANAIRRQAQITVGQRDPGQEARAPALLRLRCQGRRPPSGLLGAARGVVALPTPSRPTARGTS